MVGGMEKSILMSNDMFHVIIYNVFTYIIGSLYVW